MTSYLIRDWEHHFENNRTRELKKLDWVPIPNRMDSDGYTELLDHPAGASHLGAWLALVQIASRCEPRGSLLRAGGKPHDCASLARISRIPAEIFQEVIPRLIEIGWLSIIPGDTSNLQDGAELPHQGATFPHEGAASRAREKGMEWKEGNGTHTPAAHEITASASRPQESGVCVNGSRACPDLFAEFIGIFLALGKTLNERDNERALRLWLNYEAGEHVAIIADIRRAIDEHRWSDAKHTPMPANYLQSEAWLRRGPGRVLPEAPRSKTEATQAEAARRFMRDGAQ